jgi:NADH-quinone oxidoreductase subunit J
MNLNADVEPQKGQLVQLAGVISGGVLFLVVLAAIKTAAAQPMDKSANDIGLITNLGKVLFTRYVLPFEISSVLFLSAMIGAVVIGKKEDAKAVGPKGEEII